MNTATKAPFIHLSVHSEYSMGDGLCRIKDLIDACVAAEMPAVAITDRGNLYGAVKFYNYAVSKGIKPIFGVEIWLQADEKLPRQLITLLCKDLDGYRNLNRILSAACLVNSEEPVTDLDSLEQCREGLILICSFYNSIWQSQESDLTTPALDRIKSIFPDHFYLALQRLSHADSEVQIKQALDFANQHVLPVVATNDVLFIKEEHYDAQQVRHCISDGKTIFEHKQDETLKTRYLKSPPAMAQLFKDIPEALINSAELAKRCNLELPIGENFLPKFINSGKLSIDDQMRQDAQNGLDAFFVKYPEIAEHAKECYQERLEMELKVIISMGFSDYFLIVADFIQWAKNNDVPVGPGRGSGAGSLVAFVLGITTLDPIKYELLFERFLNPERVSLPDFDVDFCIRGRDRVINYVAEKYGRERVCQIITFGTLSARAVVRDVGRVLGQPYSMMDQLAKQIPNEIGITLQKAIDSSPELALRYQNDDDVRLIIDTAMQLEGLPRNRGTHAGGVVIAPSLLTDFLPLCKSPDEEVVLTQYDKDDAEAAGLVKFDFLGLKTLTIIHDTVKAIQAAEGVTIDIDNIRLDDTKTFDLLRRCETISVFQLESRGMRELIRRLQPDCFEDMVALVALFRPGPLQSGMVDDFIVRKHGQAEVEYMLPALEPILAPTYGVILYQEQVMQIAQTLAGYTLGGADLLRRAMGKKKPKEMAKQRRIFVDGAVERGVEEATATYIFDLMEKFAGYGFNRSHSAAYAMLAYQTAWLKAHYPGYFMAAALTMDLHDTDKIVDLIAECQRMELNIVPPSINHSDYGFTYRDDQIYYGLGALKGVGGNILTQILRERDENGRYSDIFEFIRRSSDYKLSRTVMEALIKSGALDQLGYNRNTLMVNYKTLLEMAKSEQDQRESGQSSLFDMEDIQTNVELIPMDDWDEAIRLNFEKSITGIYLTGHPYREFRAEFTMASICPIEDIIKEEADNGNRIFVGGLIANLYYINTQSRGRMAVLSLDDESARIDVIAFQEVLLANHGLIDKDKIVFISGTLGKDDRSGEPRIYATAIFTPEQMREQGPTRITLSLSKDVDEGPIKVQLKQTLRKHMGGNCAILIHYTHLQGSKSWNRLPREYNIQANEGALTEISGLIGEKNIMIHYD